MIIYSNTSWHLDSYAAGGKGGGPSTFMKYLGEYLRQTGNITSNSSSSEYSLHFICLTSNGWNILKSLRKGIPIVTRLNGVTSAPNLSRFWRIHIKPTLILERLSHITIYQNNHCKESWSIISGHNMNGRNVCILNGADTTAFFPIQHELPNGRKPTVLMHEHFRRDDGGLRTSLRAFSIVKGQMPDATLILGGEMSGPMPKVLDDCLASFEPNIRNSIRVTGRTNHHILPDLIRSADVFVHAVANSWCPHSVLEVLSCGIPVICYSGTGPGEFVGDSGIVLQSEYEGVRNGFQKFPREDPSQLADAIINILNNSEAYKAKAITRSDLFASDITSKKYMKVFEQAINNPPDRISIITTLWFLLKFQFARVLSKMINLCESRVLS